MKAIARKDRERDLMLEQIAEAQVVSREHTGVGFYTRFDVPDRVGCLDRGRWQIEHMGQGFAMHPDLAAGAMFILWIKDGKIVQLEGITVAGEDWPTDEAPFRVVSE